MLDPCVTCEEAGVEQVSDLACLVCERLVCYGCAPNDVCPDCRAAAREQAENDALEAAERRGDEYRDGEH